MLVAIGLTTIAAVACGSAAVPASTSELSQTNEPTSNASTPEPTPSPKTDLPVITPFEIEQFEELNPHPDLLAVDNVRDLGFNRQGGLPRDAITPVYEPKFVTAEEANERLVTDELVMGLNINGDARAYPVGIMRIREMVNDEVGGVPLLVTW